MLRSLAVTPSPKATSRPEYVQPTPGGAGSVTSRRTNVPVRSSPADAPPAKLSTTRTAAETTKSLRERSPDPTRSIRTLLAHHRRPPDLWGKSLDEFERDVVHPYLVKYEKSATGLRELLLEAFRPDDADDDELGALSDVTAIEAALAKTLVTGKFRHVVAIPVIPEGIQQVLRYLNAQGLPTYGLEVSYFVEESSVQGQVECFVPRLVVRPEDSVVVPPSKTGIDWTRELVLKELSSDEAHIVQVLFEWADGLGLEDWAGHHGTTLGYWTPNLKDGSGYIMMPFALGTNGRITINFGNMAYAPYPPFDSEGKRRKLQQELNSLAGSRSATRRSTSGRASSYRSLGMKRRARSSFGSLGGRSTKRRRLMLGRLRSPKPIRLLLRDLSVAF